MTACCGVLSRVMIHIPLAVVYGYFAYLALEFLVGNSLYERTLFLFTDPSLRYTLLGEHNIRRKNYVEDVRPAVTYVFSVV